MGKHDRGDGIVTGRVEWDDHRTNRTIDEVVAELSQAGMKGASDIDEACAWLTDYLNMVDGSRASKLIEQKGKQEGYAEHTLERAATKLRLLKTDEGYPRTTIWTLTENLRRPLPK